MGNINTSGVPAEVATRMLNYLNNAANAQSIAGNEPDYGPILDDPMTGYGDNVNDYDIGLTVAKRILQKRNSLAGGRFLNVSQLSGISYLGQDKFDDLVYTFSRYWERLLAVNRMEQTTGFYCGAASAQMILDFLHAWNGNPQISQDDLYDTIQDHKTDTHFATDPEGLAGCLNEESPAANHWFVAVDDDGQQEISSRRLVYTMNQYDSPPAALIYDGDHWVVVSGVTATERPDMSRMSFIVYTIRIHDPGIGSNVREVEYYHWCSNYLTGNTWGTTYQDKLVCVVDPRATSKKNIKFHRQNYKTRGRDMITLEDAKKFARESLDDFYLTDREDYKKALKGAEPGIPILAKNLRLKSKRFYYLVPFEKDNRTKVVVMINAYYGNYLGSSIVDKPRGYLDIPLQKAVTMVHENLKKSIDVNRSDIEQPYLVWRPCEQSWDPFLPFWKTKTKRRIRYVNQSGEVFSRPKRKKMGGM